MKDNKAIVKTVEESILDGTVAIRICRTYYYEDGTVTTENEEYPLKEITFKQCYRKRRSLEPGILLKINGKNFFVNCPKKNLPKNMFNNNKHLCLFCKRCYASNPSEGGCLKVKDPFAQNLRYPNENKWRWYNCMIDKYDFITAGYEVFNHQKEELVVLECDNFEYCIDVAPSYSYQEITKIKLNLARFLVPEARSLPEARRMIQKEFSKGALKKFFNRG